MAMISGAKIGVVTTWVSRSRTANATAIPNSAVTMGRPMATTEPKASSMMMMAARMPMPSLGPGLGPGDQADGLAAERHVVSGGREGLCRVDDLLDVGRRQVAGRLVEVHPDVADVAVPEIWAAPWGPNGLVTDATWGSGASAAASRSVRARLAGSVNGAVVETTTWAGLPANAGNSRFEDLLGRLGAARQVVGEVAAGGLGAPR